MTIKDINKLFTDKMLEYINQGYTVNSSTMSGTQGELAKVDLTNGKEIIRLYLDHRCSVKNNYLYFIAERFTGKKYLTRFDRTIWNGNGEKVFEKRFAEVERDKYYIDENNEEYKTIKAKQADRAQFRNYCPYKTKRINNKKADLIAYKLVKKFPKTKSIKPRDIESVTKHEYTNRAKYYVKCKGKVYSFTTHN